VQAVLRTGDLPTDALSAAAAFHAKWPAIVAQEISRGAVSVALVLPPANYDHGDWRRAAARDLARAHAPARVNLVAGDHEGAIAATLAYLASAPGVTGQFLPVDGNGR